MKKRYKKSSGNSILYQRFFVVLLLLIPILFFVIKTESQQSRQTFWNFQAVDTMKYSRDIAREKLRDQSFDPVIDSQVKNIADTGATHVAVATPYDEEFMPFLKKWVASAREYNLKVWFRGNWAGWEKWFDYPKISREEHIKKTEQFILTHQSLFENGDVFSACPECENGGPGDPRLTGDVSGHRNFLIDEYKVTKRAFEQIGKDVASNYNSMNGDVARAVMDKQTTRALDGIVAIDHYVASADKLITDIKEISRASGGKVVLGEWGAPIPDINGQMTEGEQAAWVRETLVKLVPVLELEGLSYWTNQGGSTALWRDDGTSKKAVSELKNFYNAPVVDGRILDEAGGGVKNAEITIGNRHYKADSQGNFRFPTHSKQSKVTVKAEGYFSQVASFDTSNELRVVLRKENEDFFYKIRKFFNNLF